MPSDRLINYLKRVEGFRGEIYDDATGKPWQPGTSPVGTLTIGYGHALKPGEEELYANGLTQEEAESLLMTDVDEAYQIAARRVPEFPSLSDTGREKLTEYAFNLGPSFKEKFPKFVNAVIRNDIGTQKQEHFRFATFDGETRPLEHRNAIFEETFLSPTFDEALGADGDPFPQDDEFIRPARKPLIRQAKNPLIR